MWEIEFSRKESEELDRVRRQTLEQRFSEGIELSRLAQKLWSANGMNGSEVLWAGELEEHQSQVLLK